MLLVYSCRLQKVKYKVGDHGGCISKVDSFQDPGSQMLTSFKTLAERVKELNPRYMVPVNEVSLVIPDPQTVKLAQPVKEQPSKGPPPKRIKIQPHLRRARFNIHWKYQGSSSPLSQQLWLHWGHARWIRYQNRPDSPTSSTWKT